ncbi:LAFE_0H15412g1_1 [Lachancea fermentati]|uniref:LAFE_0H15412g1_1 n=1 Tax=Lachancea fermentati TaxID=4955 RepID=A0A1G4MKX5_LACFM|nr:LAFE_0H15412g1_1 [Lachancea fermentati]
MRPMLRFGRLPYSTYVRTAFLPTIYALSTSIGQRSAIAVVRVSGSHSKYIYHSLTESQAEPIARRASLRNLYEPGLQTKNLLDSSISLYFDAPKSFTGEDMLELHVHGGQAVVRSVLNAIGSLNDRKRGREIRYAQPGEFSQRAFQNGRADLTQIEGIGELIDAETETQRRSALSSFKGLNRALFAEWRARIVNNIAQLTAIIDFGEDTDITDVDQIFNNVTAEVKAVEQEVTDFIHKIDKSSILQRGIKLVLLGQPNAGKSSLLNSITKAETAIVSNIPGTTRDAIDVPLDINGYKVVLCDTAGLRSNSDDQIEKEGIKRAQLKSSQSDIVLVLIDPTNDPLITIDVEKYIKEELSDKDVIIVVNKADLMDDTSTNLVRKMLKNKFQGSYSIEVVSCLNEQGIDNLLRKLTDRFKKLATSEEGSDPVVVSKRVQEILENDVLFGIKEFLTFRQYDDVVMASESLNYAAEGIGKITGETVGVEEVLGVVFSRFCVGK